MDVEERMSKAEAEIAALKECQRSLLQGQAELRAALERGFMEQRTAMAELRTMMDAGFAEQRAALERSSSEERAARTESIKELRLEMQRGFRWTFSVLLAILAMVMGIIARLAGAF
ncbi:MAG TPA: hypothetical protein VGD52_16910 [Pseudoduganella sp.]